MCFPIGFFGERIAIEETSIILYVLPHRIGFLSERIAIGETSII